MHKRSATVTTLAKGSLCTAHQAKLTGSNDESEHDESDNAEVDMGDDNDIGMDGAITEEEGVKDTVALMLSMQKKHITPPRPWGMLIGRYV